MTTKSSEIAPDRREPLTFSNGRVLWSRAFQESKAVQMMMPYLKGPKTRTRDLGMFLYHVYHFDSNYYKWPEHERIAETLSERVVDPDWVRSILDTPEMKVLVTYYRRLVLTPGQKMYFGLVESIDRFRNEIAEIDASKDHKEALAKIKAGTELMKSEKEVLAMLSGEGERKIRGDYEPTPFEIPIEQR